VVSFRGRSATDLEGETFDEFAAGAGVRLQRAFVAAYGPDRGADAVAEALGFGYLYRVGGHQRAARG
jgi:hypothetical protein